MATSGINLQQTGNLRLQQEIRHIISALTAHLTDSGSSSMPEDEESIHDVKIVTLSGTNKGATMQIEDLEELMNISGGFEAEEMGAYTNNNYQAVNNSIMIGGSYEARDPGVHLEILLEEDEVSEGEEIRRRKWRPARAQKHNVVQKQILRN